MKKCIIYGGTGQDASYLSEFLLEKEYEVHSIIRRSSIHNTGRIDHLINNKEIYNKTFYIHFGDICDSSSNYHLINTIQPDEIYDLCAQSDVKISFDISEATCEVNAMGTLKLINAIKEINKDIKFYFANTSELFGEVNCLEAQNENTPFNPCSPYAVSKLFSYYMVKNYREAYNMFLVNGILFNHTSPRRGENFVSRKITKAVANIVIGKQEKLSLGNIYSKRDFGYSKDYAEGMWMMLQQDKPIDYVLATQETHNIKEFIELAFGEVNIALIWNGEGINEKAYDAKTNKLLVDIDSQYFRPTEVPYLLGDSSKAQRELGWSPKTSFEELVKIMMDYDLALVQGGN
jgi:GDPmannose 4,6-dehydratase